MKKNKIDNSVEIVSSETENLPDALTEGTEIVGSMQEIVSSEILAQIETARKYPRNIKRFIEEAEAMATINADIARSCEYAVPRKKDGKQVFIKGKSVRLAEMLAATYGNLRFGAKSLGETEDGRFVKSAGFCWDTEKNIFVMIEVQRPISGRNGRFSEDMINVVSLACNSIALRNAIYRIIPLAYADHVAKKAAKVAAGTEETLTRKIKELVVEYEEKEISVDAMLFYAGKSELAQITVEDVRNLNGLLTAIEQGEISIEKIKKGEVLTEDEEKLKDKIIRKNEKK